MNSRSFVATLHDLAVATIAWLLAYWFRFNLDVPPEYVRVMWSYLAWVVPVQGVAFYCFGLYRGIWRYASIPDLRRIVLAVGTSGAGKSPKTKSTSGNTYSSCVPRPGSFVPFSRSSRAPCTAA